MQLNFVRVTSLKVYPFPLILAGLSAFGTILVCKRSASGVLITFIDSSSFNYENIPIQIYWKVNHRKIENFQTKNSNIFHISAQNIDCGYLLELPRRGGSNEYPKSMFLSINK